MKSYLIFKRASPHCHIALATGNSLRDAIANYLVGVLVAQSKIGDGEPNVLVDVGGNHVEMHPLECLEDVELANSTRDELEIDTASGLIANENSLEIISFLPDRIELPYNALLTTKNSLDLSWQIALCRACFKRDYPRCKAAAFTWRVQDGMIVTFYKYTFAKKSEIIARYRLDDRSNEVVPWHGSYDDLLDEIDTRVTW